MIDLYNVMLQIFYTVRMVAYIIQRV